MPKSRLLDARGVGAPDGDDPAVGHQRRVVGLVEGAAEVGERDPFVPKLVVERAGGVVAGEREVGRRWLCRAIPR